MNPLTIKLLAGVAALALAFGAGWGVNGWRLHADLSDEKADRANEISQASQVALADYKEGAKAIKDAATGAQVDITTLGAKLDTIDRRIKNAKPAPLPADCRPGPVRLHNLAEAAAAVDAATARPVAGK